VAEDERAGEFLRPAKFCDYTQDLASLNVLVDELSPDRRLSARRELQRLSEAFGRLSETARSVIWLRRVEGLSQRETAERLGLQEAPLKAIWDGLADYGGCHPRILVRE
jgi:RNA polymerase sigma factor (sigma-70 family)